MHDGAAGTTNTVTAQALGGKDIYITQFITPVNLTSLTVTGTTNTTGWGTGSTATLQGSNDSITWVSLMSAPLATSAAGTTKVFTINQNAGNYYYYKILGVAAVTSNAFVSNEISSVVNTAGYIPSAHQKDSCLVDTDGDGIINSLDADSDGDGCSDAFESGATTNATASYQFPSSTPITVNDANSNGLMDVVETGATSTVNYASTYNSYAIFSFLGLCKDSDNDGVPDLVDIDDDNDGVLDATEAPSCFYTAAEADSITSIATPLTIGAGDDVSALIDKNNTTATFNFVTAQAVPAGAVILSFSTLTNAQIDSVIIDMGTTTGFATVAANTAKLQALNSSNAWVDLSGNVAIGGTITGGNIYFPVSANAGRYSSYRIINGSAASYNTSANAIAEIFVSISDTAYVSSRYPKSSCSTDTDGDGVPNSLDLDSDGDGCSDAKESGATSITTSNYQFTGTDANANGLVDVLQASAGSGTAANAINYTNRYYFYATLNYANVCLDSDNDGVADLTDIDDDNDGVLDIIEAPDCYFTAAELSVPTLVVTTLATSGTILNTYDDDTTTTFAFSAATAAIGQTVFEVRSVYSTIATSMVLDFGTGTATPISTTVASFKIQGWNGSWTDIATPTSMTVVAGKQTISFANTSAYLYYRLVTTASVSVLAAPAIREITLVPGASGYQAVLYPKLLCSTDTDEDGISNNLDLDSDGDNCTDAKESGVYNKAGVVMQSATVMNGSGGNVTSTVAGVGNAIISGPYSGNGFADIIQSAADTNVYKFTYTYGDANDNTIKTACGIVPDGVLTGGPVCEGSQTQLTFTASAGTGPFTLIINGITYTNVVSGTPFNVSAVQTTTTVYNLTSIKDAHSDTNP